MPKNQMRFFSGLALAAVLTTTAVAAEEKIQPDQLPKAVAGSIKARFLGAELTSASKETENGKAVYDIELNQNGRKFESDITEDGTILEIEKQVIAKDWPTALNAAIKVKYPQASVKEVMEVNIVHGKEEKPDHLEVTMEGPDHKSLEVLASLDGKTITEEPRESEEATIAAETDVKIDIDKLPKQISAALKTKFPKAELVSAEKGDEDGKPVFEVVVKDQQQNLEVTLSPEGQIFAVEKTITADKLPKTVAAALHTKLPSAKIITAEEVWKDDKLSAYELTVETAEKKSYEYEIDATGKILEEEAK